MTVPKKQRQLLIQLYVSQCARSWFNPETIPARPAGTWCDFIFLFILYHYYWDIASRSRKNRGPAACPGPETGLDGMRA